MALPIARENLNMAGEYAVASEICRRNFYAQITLGRLKRTDILVYCAETGRESRIEVKAKQGREWPGIKGVAGEQTLLIFADFQNKKDIERPDFYILTSDDWKDFIDRHVRPQGPAHIDENYCPTWKNGYVGTSVRPFQIEACKEKWEKLVQKLERQQVQK
jgi:hypothetical protein